MKNRGLVSLFVVLAIPFLLVSCQEGGQKATETAGAQTESPSTSVAARPEFQKLAGRWERPDGGYVLEFKSVDGSGKMDAAYFNPGPIRVSKALAIQDGTATKVFVELQDVNYPGCTYSLTYDAATDQLHGQYFQAAMGSTFDVVFARLE